MNWIQISSNKNQQSFIDLDEVAIIETDKINYKIKFIMNNGNENFIVFETEKDFNSWIIFITDHLNMLVEVEE